MKIPVVVDYYKLLYDIRMNTGHYLFVVSPDGEVFDVQSTPRGNDIFLSLPLTDTPCEWSMEIVDTCYKLADSFIATLNAPATWQGQAVMGQPVCDVFRFEVQ